MSIFEGFRNELLLAPAGMSAISTLWISRQTRHINTENIFYVHCVGGAIQLQVFRDAGRCICNPLWMRRLSGPSLGARLQRNIIFNVNIRVITAPVAPSIWEEPAVGILRVTPINPAVPGCELLAPASSDVERRLGPVSGTGFPEPSVTKDEGPETPGPESQVSTSNT